MWDTDEIILGYKITTLSLQNCIQKIIDWIISGERQKYFVCANPHSLETAKKDVLFERALKESDLVIPDGIGIVIASILLGGKIRHRITGYDIFWNLSIELNKSNGFRVFFLGSTDDNLKRIVEKMKIDFPNIKIVGTYSPLFKSVFSDEDNSVMVEVINKTNPNILWVGMTAPKQETWIYRNKSFLNVNFIGPIGAVFDFYTGRIKRSHPIFQRVGLEWLPRLLREPRRLWRRNFISNPSFLLKVLQAKINQRAKTSTS